jgi:hypothetical protein
MEREFFPQTIDEAIELSGRLFKNFEQAGKHDEDRFVTVLISKPGVGKSSVVAKYANRIGYKLIDLNLACIEPTDIIGLGAREKVNGVWETIPALPSWAETALAGKCIIFVDEWNNTTQDTLAGFQKMFSDFVINGRKLPRTTHIIGACNPPGPDALYAAKKLSGAFRRRLCMLPIVDDYTYVARKHGIQVPRNVLPVPDYNDITEYCAYENMSSALVDNICLIHEYKNMTDLEKVTLTAGFGSGALDFARQMGFFSDDVFATAKYTDDDMDDDSGIEYVEWKKNPDNRVSPYQQVIWTTRSIHDSSSYSRSKRFVQRIKNPKVYLTAMELLKEKFELDYEADDLKLPDTREV